MCRLVLVALLLIAGGPVRAETAQDWQNLTKKARSALVECYERQIIYGTQLRFDPDQFRHLIETSCKQERQQFASAATRDLKASGHTDAHVEENVNRLLIEADAKAMETYMALVKSRKQ